MTGEKQRRPTFTYILKYVQQSNPDILIYNRSRKVIFKESILENRDFFKGSERIGKGRLDRSKRY